jgi:hypothetical protein
MIAQLFFISFVLIAFSAYILAESGVDLSVATDSTTWKCLTSEHNITYAVIRVYRNIGAVDENSANSLTLAHAAGINDLGAYIFPCISNSPYAKSKNIVCESPEEQLNKLVTYLADHSIVFAGSEVSLAKVKGEVAFTLNRLWFDIEDETPSKYYSTNIQENIDFFNTLISTMEKQSIPVGIYTTKTYWQNIMGNMNGYGTKYPLWYPRYDGINSLDFFTPFADFSSVQIKQTGGDIGYCGISQVDPDYREKPVNEIN